MRTIETVKKYVTVGRLRCTKCGKKVTMYNESFNKRNAYWPVNSIYGWNLRNNKEICPVCTKRGKI